MLTDEQRLIIQAVERYIDANNAFTDIHDRIRHEIRTPFHPACDYQIDVKTKTRFRLLRPKMHYPPW